jgi:glycosyltransferase involved in cell wall biosynthesis
MPALPAPPLVSVGVATFNRPEGLRRTLACIIRQTHTNLEIIVSDNASPGAATEAVVRAFARHDPRIRYHRQSCNLGAADNYRFVLTQARGEYFCWAADDDEWTPEFVAVCLEAIAGAGSAMTHFTTVIRPRGWRSSPAPIDIAADRGTFANASSFLNNFQPSLFYGLHRTATVQAILTDHLFDYYDCYFVLRQILTHGFQVAPANCFTVGIDAEEYVPKPYRPRTRALFEYLPFFRHAAGAILDSGRLTLLEKGRLLFLLTYTVSNQFAFYERPYRPWGVRAAGALLRLLRRLNRFFGMQLPAPVG